MSTGHVGTPRTCSNIQNMFFASTHLASIATVYFARQRNESWRQAIAHYPSGSSKTKEYVLVVRTKEHVPGVRTKEIYKKYKNIQNIPKHTKYIRYIKFELWKFDI